MKHRVFCVYDVAAGANLPPFMMPRDQQAIRAFTDCVNSASHQFGAHPHDYTLFFIGTFDDTTGRYTQPEAFIPLVTGIAAKATPAPEIITEENC